jgi:Ca-activated chloride channel homolog
MRRLSTVLTLALAMVPSLAFADGFIIVERPPQELRRIRRHRPHFPLSVKYHRVTVEIKGQVAITHVDQVFHNPNSMQLEGTYIFPMPEDAAVTKFSMYMNGKEVQGEVLERKKALAIYEGIVRRMQDPALLEYMGRGMFKARIFPIPARGDKRIKLTYTQVLKLDNNRCSYRYPLNTEKFSSTPLKECSVTVLIDSKTPVKSVFSPSHPTSKIKRKNDKNAVIQWVARNNTPDKDFQLYYDLSDKDVGLSIWTYKRPGRDGYFLVTISPKIEMTNKELAAKDIVFVLDTSGSMLGKKMDQAKKALQYCVENLGAADRFNIVPFSMEARPLHPKLVTASKQKRQQATEYIDDLRARGGTAIYDALTTALRMKPEASKGRPFMVVFMTDGQPTIGQNSNEINPDFIKKAILKVAGDTRIFTLGIGSDVNTKLLDGLAVGTRAEQEYALEEEDLEIKLSHFYDKVAFPVLSDCKLIFEGLWVKEVYPRKLPDLFKGGTLSVVGRYKGQGPLVVRLRGNVNGKAVEHVLEGTFGAESRELDFLPGRWAKQKIGFLLDQIRLSGEKKELKDEVVFLAKKYGLPTPYTSYLVVEETMARPNDPSQDRPRRGKGKGRLSKKPQASPGAEKEDGKRSDAAGEAFKKIAKARRESKGFMPRSGKKGFGGSSGRRAVKDSLRLRDLKQGKSSPTDDIDAAVVKKIMRKIGAKTFYNTGTMWIDSAIKNTTKFDVAVKYLSEEYFNLVKKHPKLGRFLSLGGSVLIEFEGKVYKITK